MTLGDAASEPLVHIQNFRMDFGDTTVIKDLSFDVRAGETFGFLGSNGSGKTTTLRALLGIYQPTAGTLHIGGKVFEPRDGARLGYLPEERGLYKKEAVLDVMVYFGRLKGLTKAGAKTWSLDYLERVGLADKAAVRLDKLPRDPQRDRRLMQQVAGIEAAYERVRGLASPEVAEIRWLIEELRVGLWAQTLGTAVPVSEARVRREIDRVAAARA